MKVTVWTSWDVKNPQHGGGKPKCIFVGEISAVPRVDDYIVLRDGFGAERVRDVVYDLVTGDVEIKIVSADPEDDYGPCLYVPVVG